MGKFTNAGLNLLAAWMVDTSQQLGIKYMAFGELTNAEYEDGSLYTGTETNLHDQKYITELNRVYRETNDSKIVRFEAVLGNDPEMVRDWTLREVGLYADNPTPGGDPVLVWIGKHPSTYIPSADTFPDMEVGEIVTVPIRFDNPEAVANLVTTNAGLATVEYANLLAVCMRAASATEELKLKEEITLLENYVIHN